MPVTRFNQFKSTLNDTEHPYLNGAWTPQHEEVDATEMEVIGTIPKDIDGVYYRNTENPLHASLGPYHPFDGDGMVHAMSFENGEARYSNRFVRTEGLLAEQDAGRSLWTGIAGNPAKSEREGGCTRGRMKDASSTDVVVHNKKVLSSFYQCGEGYELCPDTLATTGTAHWVPEHGLSAHPKVDLATGELLFFNYSKEAPYMHYGVVGPDGQLKHLIPVSLPGPRLPHDMAFTKNYSILVDLPLHWDEELLPHNVHANRYYPERGTRFAIVPRFGQPEDIRWFEAAPTYVLHWMNAFEQGDEIILDGYFQDQPEPPAAVPNGVDPRYGKLMANIDQFAFQSRLHRWRFNLKTGQTREERLDDQILEFGTFNPHYAGRKSQYLYSTSAEPGWFLFSGLVKHDLNSGAKQSLAFGPNRFGSEAPFAARKDAKSEDDGYLVSFITDMEKNRSECILVDARDIEAGPVCQLILPHRISSGTHAVWADRSELR